jgi:hypothetical protein
MSSDTTSILDTGKGKIPRGVKVQISYAKNRWQCTVNSKLKIRIKYGKIYFIFLIMEIGVLNLQEVKPINNF